MSNNLGGNKVRLPEEISSTFYSIILCHILRQNFNHQRRGSFHNAALLTLYMYVFQRLGAFKFDTFL